MGQARFSCLPRSVAAVAGLFLATLLTPAARSEEPGLSLSGYDPVAYFTDGKPIQGKAEIEYSWHGSRWRFASLAHRDLFIKNPEHYAPQYNGYCALGAASGAKAHKDTVDPQAWEIVDGKLYLVHDQHWLKVWQEHPKEHIRQADQDWGVVATLPAPEIVGLPCATSPPTTKIALREGGHWLAVGAQVARDETGKVVGKGDMRTQVEQVGKNVDACLAAGGATVNDVLFRVSYVTQPAAFDKLAELRLHYFGAPSPQDATIAIPPLADPDFLVQVEAVAKTK
jgi:enamine deaminase RidA (YjgF/YER057c/UK114 family)/YHS domain-containing protein